MIKLFIFNVAVDVSKWLNERLNVKLHQILKQKHKPETYVTHIEPSTFFFLLLNFKVIKQKQNYKFGNPPYKQTR